jgi:hypothetical protein
MFKTDTTFLSNFLADTGNTLAELNFNIISADLDNYQVEVAFPNSSSSATRCTQLSISLLEAMANRLYSSPKQLLHLNSSQISSQTPNKVIAVLENIAESENIFLLSCYLYDDQERLLNKTTAQYFLVPL